MWPKLIELIIKWWQARPRKDLILDMIALRDEMSACQNWYDVMKGKSSYSGTASPRVEWKRSLGHIGQILERIDKVLLIYSPEARESMRRWLHTESLDPIAECTLAVTAELVGEEPGANLSEQTLSD